MRFGALSLAALAGVALADLDARQVESLEVLFLEIEHNINGYIQ